MRQALEWGKCRVAVLAFGTLGDVLPVAVVAAALAKAKENCAITFITHTAHQDLKRSLSQAGVSFLSVSTPPVVPSPRSKESPLEPKIARSTDPWHEQLEETGGPGERDFDCLKAALEEQHREECIQAVDQVLGASPDGKEDFIIFNFFALEGWHLAELYRVPCAVVAPYVVPYSAPTSFDRRFRSVHPLLYRRLQQAVPGEVGWGEVMHWMWPLFTDRWAAWRTNRLHLSSCPLTDPVTELPNAQDWPCAPLLLYGFSPEVVECPAYWPATVHVCGFWYAPIEWDASNSSHEGTSNLVKYFIEKPSLSPEGEAGRLAIERPPFSTPSKLLQFLGNEKDNEGGLTNSSHPIFVGLSSMGSMGYMEKPEGMLRLLEAVLEATDKRAILFTAAHPPLDAAIGRALEQDIAESQPPHRQNYVRAHQIPALHNPVSKPSSAGKDLFMAQPVVGQPVINLLKDGVTICKGRLFCFSGSVPYSWLLPRCSMAIHHGGSGTTAASLWSGVPQIICPFILDQYYWAERMAWLGVAPQPLKPNHLIPDMCGEPKEFAEAVRMVMSAIIEASSTDLQICASAFSKKIRMEDGTGTAVHILSEKFGF